MAVKLKRIVIERGQKRGVYDDVLDFLGSDQAAVFGSTPNIICQLVRMTKPYRSWVQKRPRRKR